MVFEIFDSALGYKRFIIKETQRAIALYKGKFVRILTPGEHRLEADRGRLEVELHDLARPEFISAYDKTLFREHRDEALKHLTEFRAGRDEIVAIERDGRVHQVLKPEQRAVFWTDAGPWTAERHGIGDDLAVPLATAKRLASVKTDAAVVADVAEGHVGLLFADGAFVRTLAPGAHLLWAAGRKPAVKMVDLRRQSVDVTGQEILTRDRVALRVNIAADYQVVDAVKAATTVKDFADALYRALRLRSASRWVPRASTRSWPTR